MEQNIVEAHKIYAREIIEMYHGEEFIKLAEERYQTVAGGGIPKNIETCSISKEEIQDGMKLIDLLLKIQLVPSKSEARRMIEQNGIRVNEQRENDVNRVITEEDFIDHSLIIQKGKKTFKKVELI